VRRLIVNADDFGLTQGVNRAITEAHKRGVVTSTTLMANGLAFAGAVELAKSSDRWSVGCHVVLVDGEPVIDPGRLSSLVASRNPQRFRYGLAGFAVRACTRQLDPDQIEAETIAQLRKLQSHTITVSHLDTHKHTHVFPVVLEGVLRAARTCGVEAIRNPFDVIAADFVRAQKGLWKRYAQVTTLRGLAGHFRKAVAKAGLHTPDGTLGIVATGHLDAQLFQGIAENMPEGTWEFVCHPGYVDADLRSTATRLRQSREHELAVLTSPQTREALSRRGIELISYREL
jgi:hopanoid biosynthesis associated protein HpnK